MIKVLRGAAYIVLAFAALLAAGVAQTYFTIGYIPRGMAKMEMLFSVPMLIAITVSIVLLKVLETPVKQLAKQPQQPAVQPAKLTVFEPVAPEKTAEPTQGDSTKSATAYVRNLNLQDLAREVLDAHAKGLDFDPAFWNVAVIHKLNENDCAALRKLCNAELFPASPEWLFSEPPLALQNMADRVLAAYRSGTVFECAFDSVATDAKLNNEQRLELHKLCIFLTYPDADRMLGRVPAYNRPAWESMSREGVICHSDLEPLRCEVFQYYSNGMSFNDAFWTVVRLRKVENSNDLFDLCTEGGRRAL